MALERDFQPWASTSTSGRRERRRGPDRAHGAELDAKGLLVDDQGARIIRVVRQGDKRELPPLLVVSSEGSAMYGTTDLATIVDRRTRSVSTRFSMWWISAQADHFEIVFRAAYMAGYAAEGALEHVGFGTMTGPTVSPFKTREGGVLKLTT